jgi:hypothetical protein
MPNGSDQSFIRQSRSNCLRTATTSSQSYDRITHFHCRGRQGCQKSARIKLMDHNTFGGKILSPIQTNYIIKAVKDKKITRMMKGTTNVLVGIAASI